MTQETEIPIPKPSGRGGARPGSGAKKNQHRIHVGELREALEKTLGIPYVQLLAETQLKLFNDFKNDVNVKEYITFTESMCKRILEQPAQEVKVENINESLTDDELKDKVATLLAEAAKQNG